jgi:hypothetical protein
MFLHKKVLDKTQLEKQRTWHYLRLAIELTHGLTLTNINKIKTIGHGKLKTLKLNIPYTQIRHANLRPWTQDLQIGHGRL